MEQPIWQLTSVLVGVTMPLLSIVRYSAPAGSTLQLTSDPVNLCRVPLLGEAPWANDSSAARPFANGKGVYATNFALVGMVRISGPRLGCD